MEPVDGYSPEPQLPRDSRAPGKLWPYVAAIVLVVVVVVVWLLFFRSRAPQRQPAVAAEAPAAEAPAPEPAPAPVELPPLAESDDWLRRAIAGLSAHPALARWLVTDDLVRRFTAAVDNVADGISPRPHLGFLAPETDFGAQRRGEVLVVDPASYRRYARTAEVIASVDGAGAARLYRDIKPLIDSAYAELGYPDRDFDRTLARAIAHLLATPVATRPVRLEPAVDAYEFVDPALESLSPAQKHLLRMGPDNARLVREKLREIADLLELPQV